jgi:predicted metal-dependent enzyme (double-stranded beta helix superfamily)
MLPAVREFIAEVRAIYATCDDMEERFARIRPLLENLLRDEALNERSHHWPFRNDPARRYVENLLFYEDPDHGFVLNSLMKKPGEVTAVHDHAHTWTLYGVLRGGERVTRYVRRDDGSSDTRADLERVDDRMVSPGYIDFVRPYEIHVEATGDQPTVGVIFRSHRVGGFWQGFYDVATGAIARSKGPVQIPFDLS